MGASVVQSYLSDILHIVSQALLVPTVLLLLVFIGYALFCIGSVLMEYFTERKHFKVVMPKFLAALMSAKQDEIPEVIQQSGLLSRQKIALLTVYDYRTLPGDALVALIRRLVDEEESRYDHISSRNNMAARISPMIGLMGTLIPLGPGIEALGRADTAALSSSLLIAFDTTVAGLVVAAVCLAIGKIRTSWYSNYMSALDSAMATMLEKIEEMRNAGEITVKEPTDYAFLYEQAIEKAKQEKKAQGKAAAKPEAASAEAAKPEAAPVAAPAAAAIAPAQAASQERAASQPQQATQQQAAQAQPQPQAARQAQPAAEQPQPQRPAHQAQPQVQAQPTVRDAAQQAAAQKTATQQAQAWVQQTAQPTVQQASSQQAQPASAAAAQPTRESLRIDAAAIRERVLEQQSDRSAE